MEFTKNFWSKVDKQGPIQPHCKTLGPCWIWNGYRIRKGSYGRIYVNGRSYLCHRITFEESNGPVPKGKCLDHLCRVTYCVNPSHLEIVTSTENIARAVPFRKKKSHCKNGHPLSAEHIRIDSRGARICKQCHRIKTLESQRKRAKVFRDNGLTYYGTEYADRTETRKKQSLSAKKRWKQEKNILGSLKALELGRK